MFWFDVLLVKMTIGRKSGGLEGGKVRAGKEVKQMIFWANLFFLPVIFQLPLRLSQDLVAFFSLPWPL